MKIKRQVTTVTKHEVELTFPYFCKNDNSMVALVKDGERVVKSELVNYKYAEPSVFSYEVHPDNVEKLLLEYPIDASFYEFIAFAEMVAQKIAKFNREKELKISNIINQFR